MTERDRGRTVDLHGAVPEPPEELLSWPTFEQGLLRRRRRRAAGAVAGSVIVIVAVIAGSLSLTSGSASHPALGTGPRADGPLLFARSVPGPKNALDRSVLAAVAPDGSSVRDLTRDDGGAIDEAAVSPDGTKVAYVEEHDEKVSPNSFKARQQIRLVSAEGSGDHLLYQCPHGCQDLAWSPGGSDIAFAADGIQVVNLDGDVRTVCPSSCGDHLAAQPAWSPNGKQIAFSEAGYLSEIGLITNPPRPLWIMDSDGRNLRRLTDPSCAEPETCGVDLSPTWSPDGRQIGFARTPASPGQAPETRWEPKPDGIFAVDPTGHGLHEVWGCPRDLCTVITPSWSPYGDRIAFLGGTRNAGAEIVDVHTGAAVRVEMRPQPIDGGMEELAWSPSGARLALTQVSRRQGATLFIADPTTGGLTRIPVRSIGGYGPLVWLPRD